MPGVPERVRRLAARIKERYESQEFQDFWQPAKSAILDGDGDAVYAWAEARIGGKPDFVIKVSYLGKLGDATPRETWALVDARAGRLGEPDAEAIAVFVKHTKTNIPRNTHASTAPSLRAPTGS